MMPLESDNCEACVEQAVLAMTRGFRDPISLASLAKQVGLSPFHFHRLFLARMGESPMAYLRRIRVQHADHLLAAFPDASLAAIGLESGFTSAAVFSRAYRHALGKPPSKTRAEVELRAKQRPKQSERTRPQLIRLSTTRYRVKRLALDEDCISGMLRETSTRECALLGIFVDAPFHVSRSQCRYFVTLENTTCAHGTADGLEIEGGFYARLTVAGGIDEMGSQVIAHYEQVLVPAGYAIASTLFFEKFPVGAVTAEGPREVFLKVRPAHQPVI
jgi:AraC-like DNA-binding protein/DNA gyrase inhibitor GyrI